MSIKKIHQWMKKNHKTLALAESCTGGFMASQITAIPGASDYFLGSLVTYSNKLKEEILGVKSSTLKKQGAVSSQAVHEMWKGLMKKTGADYGIAVTGNAGPTGKPVGMIWFAIGKKGKEPIVDTFHIKGSRKTVIHKTSQQLFELLWRYLQ